MDVQIPEKLYFKIGEVAELTGVKSHVLRYWESEFKAINPNKSRSKQRLYRRQDIELILHLKDLLYNQGFTIAGARKQLRRKPAKEPVSEKTEAKATPPVETKEAPPEPANVDQMTLQFAAPLNLDLLREIKQDVQRLMKSLE